MAGSDWSAGISAAAAVVQAIFSVIAIRSAAHIARQQQEHAASVRAHEAELLARDVAIQIAPGMVHWANRARSWKVSLEAGKPLALGPLSQIADNVGLIAIPTLVSEMKGEYRSLGPAAHAVQRAVVAQANLNTAAPFIAAHWAQATLGHGDAAAEKEHIATLYGYCQAVITAADQVIALRDS